MDRSRIPGGDFGPLHGEGNTDVNYPPSRFSNCTDHGLSYDRALDFAPMVEYAPQHSTSPAQQCLCNAVPSGTHFHLPLLMCGQQRMPYNFAMYPPYYQHQWIPSPWLAQWPHSFPGLDPQKDGVLPATSSLPFSCGATSFPGQESRYSLTNPYSTISSITHSNNIASNGWYPDLKTQGPLEPPHNSPVNTSCSSLMSPLVEQMKAGPDNWESSPASLLSQYPSPISLTASHNHAADLSLIEPTSSITEPALSSEPPISTSNPCAHSNGPVITEQVQAPHQVSDSTSCESANEDSPSPIASSSFLSSTAEEPLSPYGAPVPEIQTSSSTMWRCTFTGCASRVIYTRACDLKKHYQRHFKSFYCRVQGCSRSASYLSTNAAGQQIRASGSGFSSKKDRIRHEMKHNPEIRCEECKKCFSRVDNMKDHVRRIHQRKGNRGIGVDE